MKKIFILMFAIFWLVQLPSGAQCDTSVCKQPPYPVTSGAGSVLSKFSGMDFIVTKTAETAIERVVKKRLGAKFNVEITPYGGRGLLQGKFKKITAEGKNVVVEGMHFSKIYAESLCEYNRFIFKDFYKEIYTEEPFLLAYEAVLNSDDLQQTVLSSEYSNFLESLTVKAGGLVMFRVFDPRTWVSGDRLHISVKVLSPLLLSGSAKEVSADIALEVENEQVVFGDMKIGGGSRYISADALLPIINKLNPFVYRANILDNRNSTIKVSGIKVKDDKVVIKGTVLVPKNNYGK